MNGITNPAIQAVFGSMDLSVPKLQTGPKQGEDFAQMLMDAVKEVNTGQNEAGQMQDDFISGRRPVELHDLMITMEKASVGMQLTTAVRTKALEAFSEIEHMQV
jgi:flagellar hook-basal body complex protein FliE